MCIVVCLLTLQCAAGVGLFEETIIAIACGAAHNLALSRRGRVYAWGWDRFGQTGTAPDEVCACSGLPQKCRRRARVAVRAALTRARRSTAPGRAQGGSSRHRVSWRPSARAEL